MQHFNSFQEYYIFLTEKPEEPKEYKEPEKAPKKRGKKKEDEVLQTD